MASIKLTVGMRDRLVHRLLEHKFGKESAAAEKEKVEIGDAFYDDVFSELDRKRMAALPEGWLPEVENIRVSIMGCVCNLDLSAKRRIPAKHTNYYNSRVLKVYDGSHPLAKRHAAYEDRVKELRASKRRAETMAYEVMATANTTKQLVERWPEIQPFVDSLDIPGVITVVSNLPAIPLEQINSMFGLPILTPVEA